jgi:hypothetical protein
LIFNQSISIRFFRIIYRFFLLIIIQKLISNLWNLRSDIRFRFLHFIEFNLVSILAHWVLLFRWKFSKLNLYSINHLIFIFQLFIEIYIISIFSILFSFWLIILVFIAHLAYLDFWVFVGRVRNVSIDWQILNWVLWRWFN